MGVAGQEQDGDAGLEAAGDLGDLTAVHAGKADIGREKVDFRLGFQGLQGKLRLVRLDHAVALVFQGLDQQHADKALVLQDQDRFAFLCGAGFRRSAGAAGSAWGAPWWRGR